MSWIKEFEVQISKILIIGFLSLVGTGIVFFFDTKSTFAQNKIVRDNIMLKLIKIDNQPEINSYKINQVSITVKETKDELQGMRNDQKEIIKILLDIKRKQK